MVDEKWYKRLDGKRATYDYSEQAKKLYSDLKAKGMSEEDIDSVIWDVARHLYPCDPCEEDLGEAMVFLFADEVSADTFITTIQDVKVKKLSEELIEQKINVLDCILNISDTDISYCKTREELLSLISKESKLKNYGTVDTEMTHGMTTLMNAANALRK